MLIDGVMAKLPCWDHARLCCTNCVCIFPCLMKSDAWEGWTGECMRSGSEKGAFCGFYSKKRVFRRVLTRGSEKGVSRRCLERPVSNGRLRDLDSSVPICPFCPFGDFPDFFLSSFSPY